MSREPEWVSHAIWWRLYPLGFVGAFPQPSVGVVNPAEHRLRRVIDWLDHAAELGASGIALGPLFTSATHGYDTLDHFTVDPRLGDNEDFDALASEAHARGLRIQLDGVFNHVGRGHPRVRSAIENPHGEDAHWFQQTDTPDGPRLATFEGHDALVTLNHGHPAVQDHVVTIMRHWLDRGADSWRLDAAYAVPTGFWADVLPRVRSTHPNAWFEAEVLHGDYAGFVRESTVDTVTQYELWKAIWSSIEDRNFHELDWALQRHNSMIDTFTPATFIGNHDVTRIASRITDPKHLPHAIVLLAMLGGTPTIYAGDEYALHALKEDRAGGDDAIRPEFPSSGTLPAGGDLSIFELHQRLIGLRRRHPWLHTATSRTLQINNDQYLIQLSDSKQHLGVGLNLADHPLPILDAGAILDADPVTRQDWSRSVAPHGWAIVELAHSGND